MMSEMGIVVAFFFSVMAAVTCAGYFFLQRRTAPTPAAAEPPAPLLDEPASTQAMLAQAFRRVGEAIPGGKSEESAIRTMLARAGYRYPSAVPVFYGVKGASALLLAVAAGATAVLSEAGASSALVAVVCGAGFGFLLPDRALEFLVHRRTDRIRCAIPAALDLLVLSVEAGQSINQAILDTSQVLREAHPDLSAEFAHVHLELRAGKSRAEALQQLGARSGDSELKKLSSVLIDSDRFGSSLGPALRTHAKYLRTRMRQQAQEAARKISVKLIFPVFFLIFPSVLLVTLGPAVLQMVEQFKIISGSM